MVEGETRRINDIVQQFLEFARPPKLAPARHRPGVDVRDAVEAMRPLASSRGVVARRRRSTAPARRASIPDQLRQAIDNLLRNAIEATPPAAASASRRTARAKGHSIEVRDTGAGIAPEALPRIFDLYFTTKADGTGVGLAVTQQIVSAHGGTIEVDSKPGAGTRMTIRLPRGDRGRRSVAERVILVVDDEQAQRTVLAGFLRKRGFEVAAGAGVDEALAAVAARTIDLVLTDLRMPGGGGLDLLDGVRQINPETPGHRDDRVRHRGERRRRDEAGRRRLPDEADRSRRARRADRPHARAPRARGREPGAAAAARDAVPPGGPRDGERRGWPRRSTPRRARRPAARRS